MSGPRLVYPHFDEHEVEHMVELTEEGHPWIHKASVARAKEEQAVPDEEIHELDHIVVRRDAQHSHRHPATR